MKKHKMMIAAFCCGSAMIFGMTGCSSKKVSETVGNQAVESSVQETEETSKAETVSPETEGGKADVQKIPETVEDVKTGAENSAVDPAVMDIDRIWGQVLSVEEGRIVIDNQAEIASKGEVVITIDPEATRVLDAVNGFPVALEDLNEGEVVYAYIGPAMTMSLPPIVFAQAVICQVPQDIAAAEYVRVQEMEMQKDDSFLLTATDGTEYQVPADCEIIPYLTRNMVRLEDVQKGNACLVWTDGGTAVHKIVLFAD